MMVPDHERIIKREITDTSQHMEIDNVESYAKDRIISKIDKGICTIPTLKKTKSFTVEIVKGGVQVSNLGNSGFLPWIVFNEAYALLKKKKVLLKGDAMNFRLGDKGLPIDSLEGHIAKKVYKKQDGDIVFRRITPIVNILIYAGICTNRKRYVEICND